MNREIKFRAWDKHSNRMIKSVAILGIWEKFVTGFDRDYIHNSQDWGSQDDFAYDFELMQFTGLQDKNGNDIYEGDIVQRGVITFSRGKFQGTYYDSNGNLEEDWEDDLCQERNIEVLGNIYENKELLIQQ